MNRNYRALLLFIASCAVGASALAMNPQDWIKKNRRKVRRVGSKQTMVAAVRGVDEPGQVDPAARNFEGVEKMEKRAFAAEKVNKFMAEGKLSVRAAQGGKP